MHRTVAVFLVVVFAVMNFSAATPLVPTLPHRSWGLEQWLMPWPVQVARAAEGPEGFEGPEASSNTSAGGYVEAIDYQYLDELIVGLMISYLFGETVKALDAFMEWLFSP